MSQDFFLKKPYGELIPPRGLGKGEAEPLPSVGLDAVLGAAYADIFKENSKSAEIVLKHLAHECCYERTWYKEGMTRPTDIAYLEGRRSVFVGAIIKYVNIGRGNVRANRNE